MKNLKTVGIGTLLILSFFLTGCAAAAYKRPSSYYNQTQTTNANYSSSSPASNLAYDAEHPVATAAKGEVAYRVVKTQYLHYEKNRAIRALDSRTGGY